MALLLSICWCIQRWMASLKTTNREKGDRGMLWADIRYRLHRKSQHFRILLLILLWKQIAQKKKNKKKTRVNGKIMHMKWNGVRSGLGDKLMLIFLQRFGCHGVKKHKLCLSLCIYIYIIYSIIYIRFVVAIDASLITYRLRASIILQNSQQIPTMKMKCNFVW